MKFIRPGAVRIASTDSDGVPANAAFRSTDGSLVLVAANSGASPQDLAVA